MDWNAAGKNRTLPAAWRGVASRNVRGRLGAPSGALQRSSARYFQRPDRDAGANGLFSDALRPDATALRGYGGLRAPGEGARRLAVGDAQSTPQPRLRGERPRLPHPRRLHLDERQRPAAVGRSRPAGTGSSCSSRAGSSRSTSTATSTTRQLQLYAGVALPTTGGERVLHAPATTLEDDWTRGGPVMRGAGGWYAQLQRRQRRAEAASCSARSLFSSRNDGGRARLLARPRRDDPARVQHLRLARAFVQPHDVVVGAVRDRGRRPDGDGVLRAALRVSPTWSRSTLSMDTRLNVTFTPNALARSCSRSR